MTAIVPDTLQGALIISVIDFFLSFVIISGIGVVLAFFPMINRVAKIQWGGLFAKAGAAKPEPAGSSAAPSPQSVESQAQDDIAAICAAVLVAMDGAPHRIVHIGPAHHGAGWVAEGRLAHHSSHRPRG